MRAIRRLAVLAFVAALALVGLAPSLVSAQEAPPVTDPAAAPVPAPAPEPPPAPAPPPAPPTVAWIDVSIKLQRVFVYGTDGSLMREIPVSTGAGGRTPLGNFRVYSRSEWTTATGNSRTTMRWMTRFKGGVGFHAIPRTGGRPLATPLGVRPVSHGCIRMADEDAAWIFFNVPNGTPVNVIPK